MISRTSDLFRVIATMRYCIRIIAVLSPGDDRRTFQTVYNEARD